MKGAKPQELKVIQGGIVDAPHPPKHLPKEVHNDWNVVTSDLAARRLLNESTLAVIEAYCIALYQIRECQKAIEKHGIFVLTKDKIPKPNPASSMMQKAMDTVSRLAVELGLTPSSRSRKGLSGPSEKEDDGFDEFM